MNPGCPIPHSSNSPKSAKFGGSFRHPDPMCLGDPSSPQRGLFAVCGGSVGGYRDIIAVIVGVEQSYSPELPLTIHT